ncbi:uncharacterized protein N7479_006722 [Penicillium vulpinum]|uniref:uncharacterized protein n=1 Tax=Penicillium vulpinum TaxID=29845 RepID=UPI002547FFF2|nr:uncharacterized protein N7479_006722 [Penicillium vulpinum]KAJ5959572.1 hypothetical protein N7479_006722 [Penicillium vulpinum]
MGRWGFRTSRSQESFSGLSLTDLSVLGLFESADDLDFPIMLPGILGIDENEWEYTLRQLVHQSDMLALAESTAW